MTDEDLETVLTWQSEPPGTVFAAVHKLGAAIADLHELTRHRSTANEMRDYIKALIEHREELNELIFLARPLHYEIGE
jgi:hypothetical protein